MKKLWLAALAALAVVCLPLAVWAQAAPAPDVGAAAETVVDASRTHDWQAALAAGLGLVAWALRRFVRPAHVVHSPEAGYVIAGVCAAVGAILPVLQAHDFTVAALVGAVACGVTAAVAIANPSIQATTETTTPAAPPPPPTALLALVGLGLVVGTSGCACFQSGAAERPECVVAHQVIDCTKSAGSSLLPVVGSILSNFVNTGGSTVDWTWVEQRLEAAGVVSGSCIFANLTNDLESKAGASAALAWRAEEAADRFEEWKVRHGLVGVQFKLHTPDGSEVLQ